MVYFTLYAIIQFVLYQSFFAKAQFSLESLVNIYTRDPYLTAMSNFLRETISKGTPQLDEKGFTRATTM